MNVTETIDNVQMTVEQDGTLTVDDVRLPTITTLALRLFLMRCDVEDVLNPLEIEYGQLA